MKPFVLIATRAEDEAADGEYEAFLQAGNLEPHELRRIRLESGPLPELDLDEYSGIIIGGSPFNASDPTERKSAVQLRAESELGELMDKVIRRDFPFFGACYGIGLLGSHLRGTVDSTFAEPVGPVAVSVTDEGRADPIFAALEPRFDAFVGHKEACSRLPENAVLLASGEGCPVQAFRIGANVYATQFHPELTVPGIITRIRVYRDYGYFLPEELDSLIDRVSAASVTEPGKLLSAFVSRHAR